MLMLSLTLTGLFLGVTVSERREVEERLHRREGEYHQALRLAAASEMTQAIAHELNQPLAAAANYARAGRAMLEIGDVTPQQHREVLDKIEREASRAGQVVRRLREFYRGGGLHLEVLDVADLLEDALAPARRRAGRERVALRLVVPDGLPPLRVDRIQAATVLHNLVTNALDSLADRPGEVEVRVGREGALARFEVTDSGPGIAPDLIDSLFDSFVTSKPDGMGLGLVISRTLVEAHGGRLWLERAHPARFCFTLPLKES
jgi:two-component system sensor kinase FixL